MQAIDTKGTEINQRQSGLKSGAKAIAKLTKAIEEAKQEQEAEKSALEKKMEEWKEIENQAFVVHDKYNVAKEVGGKRGGWGGWIFFGFVFRVFPK